MSGAINKITLQLNDLNKEAEYQSKLNSREVGPLRIHVLVQALVTFLLSVLAISDGGGEERFTSGVMYYLGVALFNFVAFKSISSYNS